MDELANALKMDPLEFRLKNLKDARLKAVLEAAAERLGWEKRKSESHRGIGIAGGVEKGGYMACLLYTSPSPRDATLSRMPSSA